jgi:prolyl-tRNA editing enzyme YbaK/EbsC (Cys-tRNA(Pro) deacylase)
MTWPPDVERVAAFLRASGAEARIEEHARPTPTAEDAADAVGCTLGQIVKSLVLLCDGAPVVALVPGDRRADTGKVARITGARRTAVATAEQVVAVTGWPPGAVAPFPLPGVSAVLVERTLLCHRAVWAGAGSESHLVALAPIELIRLTHGRAEDIVLDR